MENVYIKGDPYTLVILSKENKTELVKKYGLMVQFMKENSKMAKRMEKEIINGINKVHIMENGWII